MSRPRFLCDHDLNEKILSGLERVEPTLELVRVRDRGLDRHRDDELLAIAAEEGFILVSHDTSTMSAAAKRRVQAGQPMSGLFLIAQTAPIRPSIAELLTIWVASEAHEWKDLVVRLPL